MTEIWFYHLTTRPLESALPVLLERVLKAEARAVVMAGSEARVTELDAHLWTFDPNSWLPHGTAKAGEAADQPIWLTTEDENPNGSDYLYLTDGAETARPDAYKRVSLVFDGRDDVATQTAREHWKAFREAGHDLAYWKQNETGRWEKAG